MTNQRPTKKAASPNLGGIPRLGTNGQALLGALSEPQKAQLAGLIHVLFEKLKPQHKPVLSSLKEMGVKIRQRNVGGVECLVVEIDELMRKEYAHMSGIDWASLQEPGED